MDDEWDRARADRSVGEIERLELERLENVKAAAREAKAFIRNFIASDRRLLRQIRRHTGYLDTFGVFWPQHDPDELDLDEFLSLWDDAINNLEPTVDGDELRREIAESDKELTPDEESEDDEDDGSFEGED